MKNFRPLLLEDLQVESSGLEVLRLCVNQHLPEVEWVQGHRHDFSQCLLYLSGHGVQRVEGGNYAVNAGALICAPAGVSHAFEKRSQRIPLCLVVDFKIPVSQHAVMQISSRLNAHDITIIRQRLSWLMSLSGNEENIGARAREAAAVLDLAGILLGVVMGISNKVSHPIYDRLRRVILEGDLQVMNPAYLMEQVGLQKDHLNRMLKRECGLTVGQILAEARLQKAKELLADAALQIQDAGIGAGFEDRNYFARWFRKQTGLSPRGWRDSNFVKRAGK